MTYDSPHTFHIPVMGLAYTIDTPIKVARYGINSVISIVQDNLVEKMRSYYYPMAGEAYRLITNKEPDFRAKRITDYLNLVNRLVKKQVDNLKNLAFENGSEIDQYFEMLPDESPLKKTYVRMCALPDCGEKQLLQDQLRKQIKPGSIDVNIMTKLDKNNMDQEGQLIEDGSDAVAALRGYALSDLTNSSIILSAGMNPRLFSYMEKIQAFHADEEGIFQKRIVIKVSDYRSALIQGKMLAKKGLWVSEFRIESGLNCGGHAFATDGYLLGPILEEFKAKKEELGKTQFALFSEALAQKGKMALPGQPPLKITVQGGIGTREEDVMMRHYYSMDGTGWGTPFLLVPEATTVDEGTLSLLSQAREEDVVLSHNSPLGVRFHYLKGTTAENEKIARIKKGIPGSPCTEKYLVSNTEFSAGPICTASHKYQKKKIEQLKSSGLGEADYQKKLREVLDKECLCIGLSNAAVKTYGIKPFKKMDGVNICPGPNIAYFSEILSLRKMIDHIYGRADIIKSHDRPHLFIKELVLYIDYWSELLAEAKNTIDRKQAAYIERFYKNLLDGISYYHSLAGAVSNELATRHDNLQKGLIVAEKKLEELFKNFCVDTLAGAGVCSGS